MLELIDQLAKDVRPSLPIARAKRANLEEATHMLWVKEMDVGGSDGRIKQIK